MKIKFKDGTVIEVEDCKGKSKKEIIKEANQVYKDFKDNQVKDSQVKDRVAFNENQVNAMTNYLIQEGELDEGETLQDRFGAELDDVLDLVYWGTQYESAGAINVDAFKKGVIYEWCDSDIINEITKEYLLKNYPDDYPRSMGEFDEDFMNSTPLEIANMVHGAKFNPNDNYYVYSVYLESFNDLDEYLKDYEKDALKDAIENERNIDCDMYNLLCDNEDIIVLLTEFAVVELGY